MKKRNLHRDRVEFLIDQIRNSGYMMISRKYGKYLPPPSPIDNLEVDAVARFKKRIAIGITLNEEELDRATLESKISTLFRGRRSNSRITLFIGVPKVHLYKAKIAISHLPEELRKRIRVVPLSD
ncbi:hypothetical protein ACSSWA_01555 [Melioribacter sp. Ez-97]|uniref:hypothetical protein n=1 Tax=Melioribacter sp. Ez-97 TaxID=3423434 RepID=UPI003ED8A54C